MIADQYSKKTKWKIRKWDPPLEPKWHEAQEDPPTNPCMLHCSAGNFSAFHFLSRKWIPKGFGTFGFDLERFVPGFQSFVHSKRHDHDAGVFIKIKAPLKIDGLTKIVSFMENPNQKWMMTVGTLILETPMSCDVCKGKSLISIGKTLDSGDTTN